MILYVYAIAEGLDHVDGRRGGASEPLQLLTLESLTLVSGTLPTLPSVDQAALEAQDRVVRELHASAAALLPLRFGAGFPDEAALVRAIRTRAPALKEALKTVRGREQMTLRVTGAGGAGGARGARGARGAASGREYLEQRLESLTPREIVPLLKALHGIQRAERVEMGRTAGVVATVYHLVDRGSSSEYERLARGAAEGLADLSVRITGPAPCYAFTDT